jgi:hypothetical protein
MTSTREIIINGTKLEIGQIWLNANGSKFIITSLRFENGLGDTYPIAAAPFDQRQQYTLFNRNGYLTHDYKKEHSDSALVKCIGRVHYFDADEHKEDNPAKENKQTDIVMQIGTIKMTIQAN